jgi:hypothetical protein
MNKRIRQLVEQATDTVEIVNPDTGITHHREFFDKEKFAELIVKEMLQTCKDHPGWTGRMIGEEIKQHFGMNPNEITTAMLDRTINQCEQQLAENKND